MEHGKPGSPPDVTAGNATQPYGCSDSERLRREMQSVRCETGFRIDHTFVILKKYQNFEGSPTRGAAADLTKEIHEVLLVE